MSKSLLGRNYVTFEQYVTEYVKKVRKTNIFTI